MSNERRIERLCVFCGSSGGMRPIYTEIAQQLGRAMVDRGIGLVYGGGGIGLMGAVADAVLDAGGRATGVIPNGLATKEVAHPSLTELVVVKTMHERKAKMAAMADAFLALPGGMGTFDELFEILTWGQLGIHRKPIGILNVDNYFDPLISMVDNAVHEGFVAPVYRNLLIVAGSIEEWFNKVASHQPPPGLKRWVDLDEV